MRLATTQHSISEPRLLAPAELDILRASRQHLPAYQHRQRSEFAATALFSAPLHSRRPTTCHRQTPRRSRSACLTNESKGEQAILVGEELAAELEYNAYNEAQAATYEFPDTYKDALMAPTVPTPMFDSEEVWQVLQESVTDIADRQFKAFYSSTLGGIVTDPALMVMHVDDHMVHRGHGVFDTAIISDGCIYQLQQHLQRLMFSGGKAAIATPMSFPQLLRTVLETAGAACIPNGHIRMWLSAGRGSFGLTSDECEESAFHCMVYGHTGPLLDHTQGWKVKTSPVPAKDSYFATLKSVNYLKNVLAAEDAKVEGYDMGIFVDGDSNICEAANMNVAIVTQDDVIVTPPFERALPGLTMMRIIELVPKFIESGVLDHVARIEQRTVSLEEAKAAKEVFLTSTSLPVRGVTHWDDDVIADGRVGPVVISLYAMMMRDRNPGDKQGDLMEIPYGHATGMSINEEDSADPVGRGFGNAAGPYR